MNPYQELPLIIRNVIREIFNAIAIFSITPDIPRINLPVHVKSSFIANDDVTEETVRMIYQPMAKIETSLTITLIQGTAFLDVVWVPVNVMMGYPVEGTAGDMGQVISMDTALRIGVELLAHCCNISW